MSEFDELKKIVIASIDEDKSVQELIDEIESSTDDINLITKARKISENKTEFDVKLATVIGSLSEKVSATLSSELLVVIALQILIKELEYCNSEGITSSLYDNEYKYISELLLPHLINELSTFSTADNFLSDVEDVLILISSICAAANDNGKNKTDLLLKNEILDASDIINNNLESVLSLYDKFISVCDTCEKYIGPTVALSKDADSNISLMTNLKLVCSIFGFDGKLNSDDPIYNSQWYISKFGENGNQLTVDEFINNLAYGTGDAFKKIFYYILKNINLFNETNTNNPYNLKLSEVFQSLETLLVKDMFDIGFFLDKDKGLLKKEEFGKYSLQNQSFNICKYNFSNYLTDRLNSNFISVAPALNKINHIDMSNFVKDGVITISGELDSNDENFKRPAISDIEMIIFETLCSNRKLSKELLDINFSLSEKTFRDAIFEYALLTTIQAIDNTGIYIPFIFDGEPIQTAQTIEGTFTNKLKKILNLTK